MPEYLAPGVYVEEVSFRSKSIEGVGTTTTGFVGPTRYGPLYDPPDVLTSLADFELAYGDGRQLDFEGTLVDNYMWQAAREGRSPQPQAPDQIRGQGHPEKPQRKRPGALPPGAGQRPGREPHRGHRLRRRDVEARRQVRLLVVFAQHPHRLGRGGERTSSAHGDVLAHSGTRRNRIKGIGRYVVFVTNLSSQCHGAVVGRSNACD